MAPLERAWVGQIPIGDNGPKWVRIQSALTPLARSTLKTAWQRLIVAAIDAGVIAAEDRFNLHGLKHRGITDTPRHARGQTRWRRPRKPGDDGALRPLGAGSGGTEAAAGEARQSGLEPVEPRHLDGDLAGAKKKGLQRRCKPLFFLAPEVGSERRFQVVGGKGHSRHSQSRSTRKSTRFSDIPNS